MCYCIINEPVFSCFETIEHDSTHCFIVGNGEFHRGYRTRSDLVNDVSACCRMKNRNIPNIEFFERLGQRGRHVGQIEELHRNDRK